MKRAYNVMRFDYKVEWDGEDAVYITEREYRMDNRIQSEELMGHVKIKKYKGGVWILSRHWSKYKKIGRTLYELPSIEECFINAIGINDVVKMLLV